MKELVFSLILVIFLSSCSTASPNSSNLLLFPTPSVTFQPSLTEKAPSIQATSTPTIGPTDIFITQVMATKYAARTQYAALPTITPTPTIPPNSPDCRASDLQITFHSNGATGRIVLELGVKNVSKTPCFLPSWPVVQFMDRTGNALDIAYDYVFYNANPSILPPTQESNPSEPIQYGLDMNQSASLALLWGNWCQASVNGGIIIRVFLLGKSGFMDIPTDIGGGGRCDDPSHSSTVDVVGFGY